ncbi:MAG: pyridoxal phosphate-dependent aminotransferase [Bacteroidales bacterium]|nr:pyridoxal phosphate-dependent aminotransferase [Bacteroidales bacterium]
MGKVEKVSDRLNRISVSQTLEMAKRSRELREKGVDIIDLSIGQPDFKTPSHIKEAAKRAIENDVTFYSPVPGFKELRQAVANKFKYENGLNFEANQIVISNGAKQAIANVILSLISAGDEILVPVPYWVSYGEIINLADGKNVFIKTDVEDDYKVSPQQIREAITEKTRLFIFSSPSNPAGSVYSRDELRAIAEVLAEHEKIYVISDEIYEHINFIGKHESIAQFECLKDRVIVINGVSKGYAMTGWRVGYMAAPQWVTDLCIKLQGQYTSGASSISQMAALEAISSEDNIYTLGMNAAFKRRRDLIIELISDIKGIRTNIPQGAFYVFPDISEFFNKSNGYIMVKNDSDLALYLLNEAHVAVVPGNAFGDPSCVRFSYATSREKISLAFERIKFALEKLK